MPFYKGYVRTKNKRCIDKYKDATTEELKTFDEVKRLDEYAGILSSNTVLIDIDDMEQSNKLLQIVQDKKLKCRVNESRLGMHFLFLNSKKLFNKNKTKTNTAAGFVIDIKTGMANSYEVIKVEGKTRKCLYDTEEYEDCPKWLLPLKSKIDFTDLDEGDGRNQELFNYILTLQSNDFSVDEARECIEIINKYMFKTPLDEHELEVILRDEAFQMPIFYNGKTFLFDKFAMYLKSEHYICRINNQLHLYRNGHYVSNLLNIENAMIQHIPTLNAAKRTEVLKYLDVYIRDDTPEDAPQKIAFKNGVFDVLNETFEPLSPHHIICNLIPWDYNPNGYCEATDKVLDNISCNDENIRSILEEMIGYAMFRRNELGKAFFLTGSGKNGKSTFLNMLKKMLGKENISSLDMKMLGDRFSTIMMFQKLANIGDDISDEFISDASLFKKVVTGESIGAEQKGQAKFEFNPYVKLFFSANSLPRMGKGKDSEAILRRLIIVPFNARFDKKSDNYNAFIWDKLSNQESMEYLIMLGVNALKRVLRNQEFTKSEKVIDELNDFELINNPLTGFFNEINLSEIENEPTKDVYEKYIKYCCDNNLQQVSKIEFSKQVKKRFDFTIVEKRVKGVKYRIFVKNEGEK